MLEQEEEEELTYSLDDIQKLLQCSICLDRFKQPKLLPCQHTFCQEPCLEGLVRGYSLNLKCPECRAEHRLPYNGVAGFPNNLTIKSFLDLRRKRTRNDSGDVERGGGAGAASADCGQIEQPVPSTAAASRSGCANCNRETFLAKCSHCTQILCEPCTKSHIEQVRNDVLRLVSQLRRGIPRVSNVLSVVDDKAEQFKQRAEVAKADVTEVIERFIMELRSRQRLLHNKIDMFLLGEIRSLTAHKENLQVEIASISSFCQTVESTFTQPDAEVSSDIIKTFREQCVQFMERVRRYEDGSLSLPSERSLRFLMEENRLSDVISNFGEISSVAGDEITTAQNDTQSQEFTPVSSHESTPDINISRSQSEATSSPSPWRSNASSYLRDEGGLHMSSPSSYQTPSSPRSARSWNADYSYPRTSLPSATSDDAAAPRRSLQERRRQHYSDSRISALIGGRVFLNDPQTPGAGRRRTNISRSFSIPEEPYHSDSALTLSRSRTYTPGDSFLENDDENPSPIGHMGTITRSRPTVRFNNISDEETDSTDSEEMLRQVTNFEENESTHIANSVNNYQSKGRSLIRFGQRGNDTMEFTWPRGIAVTREDNILIADSSNHRVQIFDQTGRFLKSFGSYGHCEGEFDCLAGISVNSFGQIIIVDRYNHRIQVFDHHGHFVLAFGEEGCDHGQLLYPWGVACDRMGFIYVCDKENHRIQVFQSNGNFVRAFGFPGHGPGQFENPYYLSISPDSKVYVTDSNNHRIQVFSIYGDYLFSFGSPGSMQGQLRYPKGIVIDPQGFVIVADSGNNRVQVFHGDGRFNCMFGAYGSESGQFKGLEDVALLSNGNIVVSDRENHRIQIF